MGKIRIFRGKESQVVTDGVVQIEERDDTYIAAVSPEIPKALVISLSELNRFICLCGVGAIGIIRKLGTGIYFLNRRSQFDRGSMGRRNFLTIRNIEDGPTLARKKRNRGLVDDVRRAAEEIKSNPGAVKRRIDVIEVGWTKPVDGKWKPPSNEEPGNDITDWPPKGVQLRKVRINHPKIHPCNSDYPSRKNAPSDYF